MNIRFSFIDTHIDKFEPVSFIGQNSCQSGKVAGRLIGMEYGSDLNYLVLNITTEKEQLQHLGERERGFRLFFKSQDRVPNIFTIDIHDVDLKSIKTEIKSALNKFKAINGIFVTGSKVHLVAHVLESIGLTGIRLVGYDLIKENIEYLKKDLIHFLISQQPEEQGYLGIKSLFDIMVNNKEIPAVQSMPVKIICRENLEFNPGCD